MLQSGALVALDVPAGSAFGVDWQVHTVGPAFLGMKLIPPGLHLAIYGSTLHALGFFFVARPGGVLAFRWDARSECLERSAGEEAQLAAQVHALELDARLGAYDAADPASEAADGTWATWSQLASYIDERVLARARVRLGETIAPDGAGEGQSEPRESLPVAPTHRTAHPPEPLAAVFTRVRANRMPAGQPAGAVTDYHFDGSARLEELLRVEYAPASSPAEPWPLLLGELQLAFVLMLQLHSHSALVFWREMLALLCTCERALAQARHAPLFEAFARVLREQLARLPPDFFIDALSGHNFLAPALAGLRELLDGAPARVQAAARPLWALLAEHFGLDADALARLADEDGPTVVEHVAPS